MKGTRYFDRRGHEVAAQDATDARGILRSGFSLRVPMTARDSPGQEQFTDARSFWDANKDTLRVVGLSGGTEGNKPGFRVLSNDLGRIAKDAAYKEHEEFLREAWRSPSRDVAAETGFGERGETASDRRTLEQLVRDHDATMDQCYRDYAKEISERWRKCEP